jgi:hypothetical protein
MTTQPLPRGQQLLLQRMLAFNGYYDPDAQKVFAELKKQAVSNNHGDEDDDADDGSLSKGSNDFMGTANTLEEAFCSINEQLKPGFGLEIVSLVDPNSHDESGRPIKFHAVVNLQADIVSKASFGRLGGFNDHERAFIRLALQRLVEEESLSLKRSDLINLRSDLQKGYNLPLNQAEHLVQVLLEQGWLRVSTPRDEESDDSQDEDNDRSSSSKKRKKKAKQSKSRSYHRNSVQNKLELAPRTFLELSHYLTDVGLDPQDMPQFLFHRKNDE